jgi:outer membrane protein assembly factor BamE
MLRALPALALLQVSLSGCSLLYRQDVQQGSVVEQEMIDQLEPGMSKRQVELIMGTPAHLSPFHGSRWNYVYSYKNGRSGEVEVKNLALYFEGDQLLKIEGDYKPSKTEAEASTDQADQG